MSFAIGTGPFEVSGPTDKPRKRPKWPAQRDPEPAEDFFCMVTRPPKPARKNRPQTKVVRNGSGPILTSTW